MAQLPATPYKLEPSAHVSIAVTLHLRDWSTSANWNAAVAAGDSLTFAGTARLAPANDFAAGTSFSGITFGSTAGAFTVAGNPIVLTGNITDLRPSMTMILDFDMAPTATPTAKSPPTAHLPSAERSPDPPD